MSGMADKILDACEEDENFNLEELFPNMYLPANDNVEESDSDDLCIHD